MHSKLAAATLFAALCVVPASFGAVAAKPAVKHETQADLEKEAKVSIADAKKIALKKVKGRIESGELEREYGKLIYSFDIRVPHKTGITEVAVNAIDGSILNVHHETPAKEAAEKKQEASEKQH